MNRTICIQHAKRLAFGLAALALAAAPSFAQTTVDLCATTGTAEVTPGVFVPIWGYVLGSTCTAGTATLPNPVIRATAGETLTINLTNNLTETVSFFVPGVPGTATGGVAGVFTTEASGGGGIVSYSFTPDAGTYLYQSATSRIRTHVPMGLYGALVVDSAANTAYPGVTYSQDAVLVYSAIDPALNANPATYGGARVSKNTMSVADEGFVYGWKPEYFLINGKAYPSTGSIAINVGADVLLRFVNAGLDTVVPTLDGGLYVDLIAEDGNLLPVAFSQYGLELQPGKTVDALINIATSGTYSLYDRALNLTNGPMPATSGGMLVRLVAAPVPTAVDDAYPAVEDTQLIVNLPGVLGNDLAAVGGPIPASYTASLVSNASNGSVALAADGSFTYTPNLNFFGVDSFTYRAVDVVGPPSNVATVTITVALGDNDPPVADPQSVTTPIYTAVAITLTGSDPDGDALSFAISVPPANGSVNGLGAAVSYTPNSGFYGVDSFTFNVSDGVNTSADATVTITVLPTLAFSTSGNANVPGVAAAAPPATGDNADLYDYDGTTGDGSIPGTWAGAFTRIFDSTVPPAAANLPLPLTANIDGLVMVDSAHFYVSFATNTTIVGLGTVQDEDIVEYNSGVWSVAYDMTAAGLTGGDQSIDAFDIEGGVLFFSTVANSNPPGVAGTADNADIYSWNGAVFARVVDVTALVQPLPGAANVDALVFIDATHFYLSFAAADTLMPAASGLGNVQDEDVVYYNNGTWSVYFDGTAAGLGTDAALDLDAIQIP